MWRRMCNAVVLGLLTISGAAGQVVVGDNPTMIRVDTMNPALVKKIVGRALSRDFKGNRAKAKVNSALDILGGPDRVADLLSVQVVAGKPRFIVNAAVPRPINAVEVTAALQDVVDHTFSQLLVRPELIDEERYAIVKVELDKLKAALPGGVQINWKADSSAQILPVPTPSGGAAATPGKWKLVATGYAVDCCGRAVPTFRWAYTAGTPAGPLSIDGMKAVDAPRLFWRGHRLFWEGDPAAAWVEFDAAVRLADDDARYWYFKALAEAALGRSADALKSRRRGAELQAEAKPNFEELGRALERVQGPVRMWLREGLETIGGRP